MLIHNPKELGFAVRSKRRSQGLSQVQLGEFVNMKQATVSQFENRPGSAQIETLFKILTAANLELHLISKDEAAASGKIWDEVW